MAQVQEQEQGSGVVRGYREFVHRVRFVVRSIEVCV
jgi:hypothetical protein